MKFVVTSTLNVPYSDLLFSNGEPIYLQDDTTNGLSFKLYISETSVHGYKRVVGIRIMSSTSTKHSMCYRKKSFVFYKKLDFTTNNYERKDLTFTLQITLDDSRILNVSKL